MIGRGRREAERSRGLRWFAAGAGLAVAGATVLAMGSAHASAPAPVSATFGVTGVSTSNCSVSIGGSDVYAAPGATLNFKSSVVGITVLGIPLSTSGIAGFDGKMVIDPSSGHPTQLELKATKTTSVTGLSAGDHPYTWTATALNVLGIPLTLGLDSKALAAGAKLAYSGTIHVTNDAANCGVAVTLPGVQVSASATGLPPIKISLPPVKLPTIAVPSLPNIGSIIPGSGGGTSTNPGQGGNPGNGSTYTPPGLTIPQEVVPSGDGNGPGTVDNSGFGSALPDLGNGLGSAPSAVTSTAPNGAVTTLDPANTQQKAKTVQLAANPSPSAQMPVLLAIIAIIALSLVTATYARLYLLRKPPNT